jgi:hypothetical protein
LVTNESVRIAKKATRKTDLMRNIRMIISPFELSVSFRLSRLRSLIVPRFRCAFTDFARCLIVGVEPRFCCIMRTHSSMRASLSSRIQCVASQSAHRFHMASKMNKRTCASHSIAGRTRCHGTSGFGDPQGALVHSRQHRKMLVIPAKIDVQ